MSAVTKRVGKTTKGGENEARSLATGRKLHRLSSRADIYGSHYRLRELNVREKFRDDN